MLKPHSQSSILRIFSFVLGSIFGVLLTILVLKFIEQNELLQQTTKPETHTGMFRELPATISQYVNLNDSVKILCFVLTHPGNHLTKAVAVKDTWGKRCNKLVFISSQEETYLDVLKVNVTAETRLFLWQKTKLALSAIYENFLDDYDYFLKADDDTWIFMENLRQFLYAYSPEMPIYFGCKLKPFVKQGYMSGSAYVLTREALKRFYTRALPHSSLCYEGSDGAEDTELGSCLQSVGVLAGDSRDDQQRSRFLPFPPDGHTKNVYGTTWLDTSTFYEIKKVNNYVIL